MENPYGVLTDHLQEMGKKERRQRRIREHRAYNEFSKLKTRELRLRNENRQKETELVAERKAHQATAKSTGRCDGLKLRKGAPAWRGLNRLNCV